MINKHSEDIIALVELYDELIRKYKEACLSTDYLKSTAGVELFRRDLVGYDEFDGSYVLDSLAKAEIILNKYLSNPKEIMLDEDKSFSQLHLEERIVNEGHIAPHDLASFKYQREIKPNSKNELVTQILGIRVHNSRDYMGTRNNLSVNWVTHPEFYPKM